MDNNKQKRDKALEIIGKSNEIAKKSRELLMMNKSGNADAINTYNKQHKVINISDLVEDKTIDLPTDTPNNKDIFEPSEISGRSTSLSRKYILDTSINEILAKSCSEEVRNRCSQPQHKRMSVVPDALSNEHNKLSGNRSIHSILSESCSEEVRQRCSIFPNNKETVNYDNRKINPDTFDVKFAMAKTAKTTNPNLQKEEIFFPASEMRNQLLADEESWAREFAMVPNKQRNVVHNNTFETQKNRFSNMSLGKFFELRSDTLSNIKSILPSDSPKRDSKPGALIDTFCSTNTSYLAEDSSMNLANVAQPIEKKSVMSVTDIAAHLSDDLSPKSLAQKLLKSRRDADNISTFNVLDVIADDNQKFSIHKTTENIKDNNKIEKMKSTDKSNITEDDSKKLKEKTNNSSVPNIDATLTQIHLIGERRRPPFFDDIEFNFSTVPTTVSTITTASMTTSTNSKSPQPKSLQPISPQPKSLQVKSPQPKSQQPKSPQPKSPRPISPYKQSVENYKFDILSKCDTESLTDSIINELHINSKTLTASSPSSVSSSVSDISKYSRSPLKPHQENFIIKNKINNSSPPTTNKRIVKEKRSISSEPPFKDIENLPLPGNVSDYQQNSLSTRSSPVATHNSRHRHYSKLYVPERDPGAFSNTLKCEGSTLSLPAHFRTDEQRSRSVSPNVFSRYKHEQEYIRKSDGNCKIIPNTLSQFPSEWSIKSYQEFPLKAAPTSILWGSIKLRTNVEKNVTLKNTSGKRLSIKIEISGPGFQIYGIEQITPLTLHGHECHTIRVIFCPTVFGPAVGKLTFRPTKGNTNISRYINLCGYGGNASIYIQGHEKGPVGPAFIKLGDINDLKCKRELERNFIVYNKGTLRGFTRISLKRSRENILGNAKILITPEKFIIRPNSYVKVNVKYQPRRDDMKKLLRKELDVRTVATLELLYGDNPNRQRLIPLIEKMKESDQTFTLLDFLLTDYVDDVKETLNGIRDKESAVDELFTFFKSEDISLTINHSRFNETTEFGTDVSGMDDTLMFQTLAPDVTVVMQEKLTQQINEVDKIVLRRYTGESWSVTPQVLEMDPFNCDTQIITINSKCSTSQSYKITTSFRHLFKFSITDGTIDPKDTIKVSVQINRCVLPSEKLSIFIYMENDRVEIPVNVAKDGIPVKLRG